MKIGVLTFIKTINYGALFQAYALQSVLEKKGYQVEILQYVNSHIEKMEMNKNFFSIKSLVKKIVLGNRFKNKKKKFELFEKKYIHNGAVVQKNKFENDCAKYDIIVVGSDQVWNLDLSHEDLTFFLKGFSGVKRSIAYAPSFGNNLSDDRITDEILHLLNGFDAISVREQSGANLIQRRLGCTPSVVLDPTLLMEKSEWKPLITFRPPYDHYILVYFPNDKKKVFEFAKRLSDKKKCRIVYLSISPRQERGVETIYDASPEEWLGWLFFADYTIVGSFHGTAFSLNYEKQFFYEGAGEGSRIDNLVSVTGTKNRNLDTCNIDDSIDYARVREKLKMLRLESMLWLRKAIENG